MKKPNRLINERSPYLLQHAYNPVDWYPWGEEAFQKAKNENKPIFLSIGYSTCHWCHVMEKESFEDRHIAELLNTYFIPVKVDREERPDVDDFYMKAVMAMTGHGGWPLTVILTPDLKPFFGGTYFPPRRRAGLRGLDEILRAVAELWTKSPDEIKRAAEQTSSVLKGLYTYSEAGGETPYNLVVQGFDSLVNAYDDMYGGFGTAPKFPMPSYIEFLHTFYFVEREQLALKMSAYTLEKMARGGIFDQLRGGFFRYSTDRIWLIPHFEKMLYDNALLARVYLQAYLLTHRRFFREVAEATLDWMVDELSSSDGGFYSAVDADSPEGEGAYYTWRKKEVEQLLERELAEIAIKAFGITEAGNFEHGKSVLTFAKDVETLSNELQINTDDLVKKLAEAKAALLEARQSRTAPAVDDKVIASWNGLAISACSLGYQVTKNEKYLEAAVKAADFILGNLWKNGRMLRFYRNSAGGAGFLDDYAYMANGLIDLFQTCFETKYLEQSLNIVDGMLEIFWDSQGGGFFYSYEAVAGVSRLKDAYDGVMPSGNSMAAWVLIRLYELTGRSDYLEKANAVFKCFSAALNNHPAEHAFMLQALAAYLKPRTEIVIACDSRAEAEEFVDIVQRFYHPFKTVVLVGGWNKDELAKISPLVADKSPVNGLPTAYICENYACRFPVTERDELLKAVGWHG
ncbi:MAG: thioredoxin domain-containing protein [Candidatus Caldarchaeum sp.]|uniref:Thioredoxin domain-containing protein n=1 Tax=Caldiarchaeum subterraneum TaxID=311458 RepID=A0A7C5QEG1_CALS0